MKDNPGYDFFMQASKLILFVPVVILVLLIMIVWGGWGERRSATGVNKTALTTTPTPAAALFNLTGPFACSERIESGTVSALIKDHKIIATVSAQTVTRQYLLNGDCVYLWDKTKARQGTKICGLSGTLSMAESLISSGLLPLDSLLSAGGMADKMPKGLDVQALMKSCRKETSIQPAVFDVPKGVQFVEKKEAAGTGTGSDFGL